MKSQFESYLSIVSLVDEEFRRNLKQYGERIHCGRGCTDCCHHLFQITEPEAAYVSRAVKALPEAQQLKLRARASRYLKDREQLLKTKAVPDAWGSLPPPGSRLACPALEDGACTIYDHRPLICHKFGMPIFNPRKPDRIFACELNFQPGEELEVPELVQIQTEIHNQWEHVQAKYNTRGGRRDPHPITVARAILEDFEDYLPASHKP